MTTGAYSFASVIANVVAWFTVVLDNKTQFAVQIKIRLISQLIDGISKVLKKLLKYFNDNFILTSFVPKSSVWPVVSCLNLNETLYL